MRRSKHCLGCERDSGKGKIMWFGIVFLFAMGVDPLFWCYRTAWSASIERSKRREIRSPDSSKDAQSDKRQKILMEPMG
jgi:hypothetical protein